MKTENKPLVPVSPEALGQITGGAGKREKFVSAFYCELCGRTIHLGTVYSLERAKREHNAKVHPGLR